jgi:hypothetical protein
MSQTRQWLRNLRQSRWLAVVAAAFIVGAALGRQFGLNVPLVAGPAAITANTVPLAAPLTASTSGGSGTLFGSSVMPHSGETYAQAVTRVDQQFGGTDIARVFYGGLPAAWPGKTGSSFAGPMIVSFKDSPANVLAGKDDAKLTSWFAGAPTDRTIFWSYFHEPEEEIAAGQFTAADYRAAWAHVDALADKAANPRLRSTLILMCYSLQTYSGRTWTDYYNPAHVDVLGWDCYNTKRDAGAYSTPSETYGLAAAASVNAGKPWGIAETGSYTSPVVGSDAAMAQWLHDDAVYLRSQGARFVSYFDSNPGEGAGWTQDWRIDNLSKSVAAWTYQVQQ